MKTILITGGTGFLGSNLIEKLIIDYQIILLKRSFSNKNNITNFIGKKNFKTYNLNEVKVENIFTNNKIDIIFHCATSYGRKGEDDIEIIESNFIFPLKLLNYSIKYNINTFYNIDTFYNININLPKGLDLYVLSKKQFLEYGKLKSKKNKEIQFINLKLYHLYGPNDSEKKFIPSLIKNLSNNIESIQLTFGEQIRDLIYIKDAVNVINNIITTVENNIYFEEYEIGTGKGIYLKDLIKKIKNKLKSKTKLLFGSLPYREGEIMKEIANTDKIDKILKKNYNIGIEKGLDNTISFFTEKNK